MLAEEISNELRVHLMSCRKIC